MNDINGRFDRWVEAALRTLEPGTSVDMHLDELIEGEIVPAQTLDLGISLLGRVRLNSSGRILGKVAMLMVPLRCSRSMDCDAPTWESLSTQLSSTPPSIYLMDAASFLMPDPAVRFIVPLVGPRNAVPDTAIYYQCWRNPDDDDDEGWARDVRVVLLSHLWEQGSSTTNPHKL